MILRKPYAFIIKQFRLIHLIMFLCTVFITSKVYAIHSFLTGFINDGMFEYKANLVGSYINLYMFIAIGIIIALSLIVISLFVWKKIDYKYYISIITYYVIIFAGLIVMSNFLESVLTTNLDTRVLKLYRDSTLLISLPGYYFIITTLINAIGFNIKKFDFSKDLKALNAEVEDNEEFEFVVGKDTYKYKRRVRRAFREFKYYIKENTFFFSVLCGIVVVATGVSLYLTLYVYKQTFDENETFLAGGLAYTVKESYLTQMDYSGKKIDTGMLYLIVKVNISNTNFDKVELDFNNYRIVNGNENIYPITNKGNYFIDLGDPNLGDVILQKTSLDYMFIYELPEDYFNGSYTFRIVNDVSLIKGEIAAEYNDTIIKPKFIESIETVGVYNLDKEATFEESAFKESNLTIKKVEIKDSFKENYKYCISNTCYTGVETLRPNNVGSKEKTLMKFTIDYYLDPESNLYATVLSSKKLFSNFGTITYLSNGTNKTTYFKEITPKFVTDDTIYIEVPAEVKKSVEVTLNITVRDKNYLFVLKN